jgi:hypothetical protein
VRSLFEGFGYASTDLTPTLKRRLPVYAALTYQGRAALDPAEPFDLEMIAAVNRHQRRNKGFGPALGPEASLAALSDRSSTAFSPQRTFASPTSTSSRTPTRCCGSGARVWCHTNFSCTDPCSNGARPASSR